MPSSSSRVRADLAGPKHPADRLLDRVRGGLHLRLEFLPMNGVAVHRLP
jgi:hypothetical protein